MPLSQKGAGYDYRTHIKDPHVLGALDDLASQIQAIRAQGQFGQKGALSAPSPPSALMVSVTSGIFTVTVVDNNPAAGVRYRLQWSKAPNFSSAIEEELATTSWQRQLSGQKLYFRVASKFLNSVQGPWVYFGPEANPTALQG